MKKVNKHGLKLRGLKAASRLTGNWNGYTQISYDRATGGLLADWHGAADPLTNWSEYHDRDVITVCNTRRHMTMQQIADAVRDKLDEIERTEEHMRR